MTPGCAECLLALFDGRGSEEAARIHREVCEPEQRAYRAMVKAVLRGMRERLDAATTGAAGR